MLETLALGRRFQQERPPQSRESRRFLPRSGWTLQIPARPKQKWAAANLTEQPSRSKQPEFATEAQLKLQRSAQLRFEGLGPLPSKGPGQQLDLRLQPSRLTPGPGLLAERWLERLALQPQGQP